MFDKTEEILKIEIRNLSEKIINKAISNPKPLPALNLLYEISCAFMVNTIEIAKLSDTKATVRELLDALKDQIKMLEKEIK